jgi:hypothetical protein
VIHIHGLNEPAIHRWWRKFKRNRANVWDTFRQNCSTTVYDALVAGGAPPWPVLTPWTPGGIDNYARAVGGGGGILGAPPL